MEPSERIPCPFVYARGRRCTGVVVRVEVYKADLAWDSASEGDWTFSLRPRSHFHVFCSIKGNHAGFRRDAEGLKFYYDRLPDELRRIVDSTYPHLEAGAPAV